MSLLRHRVVTAVRERYRASALAQYGAGLDGTGAGSDADRTRGPRRDVVVPG